MTKNSNGPISEGCKACLGMVTPAEFQRRLEGVTEDNRLSMLADEERKCSIAMAQFKGYTALSNATKSFFLETIERSNREIVVKIAAPVSAQLGMFITKLVIAFRSLRAAEVTAMTGYPFQGYTLVRNVHGICVLASAALQGMTDFERLEGLRLERDERGEVIIQPFNLKEIKHNRIVEERVVRMRIDGKNSGFSPEMLDELKALDDLYDRETHGG